VIVAVDALFWIPFVGDDDDDFGFVAVRRFELRLSDRCLNLSICFASKIIDCLSTLAQHSVYNYL